VIARDPGRLGFSLLALLVVVVAVVAYSNTAFHGFALDDNFIIRDNPRVHGLEQIDRAITEPYWPNAPGSIGLYRPVTAATYALQWEYWEGWPVPYHYANIALHAVVSLLVLVLLFRLTAPLPAAAGALLFAVHPVHSEAVANVVGRAELLAALFFVAACLLYLGPRRESGRGGADRWWIAAGIGALYLLALGAKEIAVTLPGALLVLEGARAWSRAPGEASRDEAGRWDWLHGLLRQWPTSLTAAGALAVYLAARAAVLGTSVGNDVAGFLRPLSAGERVLTAVSVWPEYLRLMLFPAHLVADYSPGVLLPVTRFGWPVVAGIATGLAAAAIAFLAWRRARLVSVGILWFAVVILPVSNLLLPIGVLLAERVLYLPSVGVALGAAGVLGWVQRRGARWTTTAYALAVVALVAAGVRTWTRNPVWRDTGTVIRSLATDHPESFRVQWMRGDELRRAGRFDDAVPFFRSAVSLVPYHYQLRNELGQLLVQAGRPDQAVAEFSAARDAVPELPDAAIRLVDALLRGDRVDEAVHAGRAAVKRFPEHRGAHHQLAVALTRAARYEEALLARRAAIRLAGDRAGWPQHLQEAELLLRLGRDDEAAVALDTARDVAPEPEQVPTLETLWAAIAREDPGILPYR
jgi:Flp pilus assembly protein TadD